MPSTPASPAPSHRPATGQPPHLQLAHPTGHTRAGSRARKLPSPGQLAVDTVDGGVIDLRHQPDVVSRLPRGKADGRYRCCSCGAALIFEAPATPDSPFTPRFRHDTGGRRRCTTPKPTPEIQAVHSPVPPASKPAPSAPARHAVTRRRWNWRRFLPRRWRR
ncbi:hypothetical protein AB0D57_17575 [Streptomyces sp. NPDC048275]|uniref:hypothetical protein n=1 Tax=Streptomyces sp. NPDC048275 TaxID=3155629 RepID=UPI00340ADB83